ncbi:hypothetical protein VNO77_19394 [Canavalia gladiata]|uniref:Uncharacterized protein n=1 Tax=Canavalia gladiata TaxID=3824 RepID=A0AAN9QPK1_CANGL
MCLTQVVLPLDIQRPIRWGLKQRWSTHARYRQNSGDKSSFELGTPLGGSLLQVYTSKVANLDISGLALDYP